MLLSFKPAVGLQAGTTYTLPTETARKRGLAGVDDSYQPARLQGKHFGAGIGSPFFGGGTVDSTFAITPHYGGVRGFTGSDMAITESALAEFYIFVIAGGLGTLIDSPPTGYIVNGMSCTQKTCTARVMPGSIQEDWQDGGTVVEITITLECPVGYWTCNTSTPVFLPFN